MQTPCEPPPPSHRADLGFSCQFSPLLFTQGLFQGLPLPSLALAKQTVAFPLFSAFFAGEDPLPETFSQAEQCRTA